MTRTVFEGTVALFAAVFAVAFSVVVVPALIDSGDIAGAFAAGFVNPFSSGYSLDAIMCGLVLVVWVAYERSALGIRHGWVAVLLSVVPGVATAFGVYLFIRSRQLSRRQKQE